MFVMNSSYIPVLNFGPFLLKVNKLHKRIVNQMHMIERIRVPIRVTFLLNENIFQKEKKNKTN